MHIPCTDCLIIPICRHKYFIDMKNECQMIEKFLFKTVVDSNHAFCVRRINFELRVNLVSDAIRPVLWDAKSINTRLEVVGRGKKYYANRGAKDAK